MNLREKKWLNEVHRIRESGQSRFDKIRLDKNEWISEFPVEIFETIKKKLRSEHIIAYPETSNLYSKIANHHQIESDNIVVTTGIDGGIRNCFDLFVNPGKSVVVLEPTFAMVEVYCKLYNAEQIRINYNQNLELNVNQLLDSLNKDVNLLIIANPNSPTGTVLSKDAIDLILKKAESHSIPVLIDEAYFGFYQETVVDLIHEFPNLVVARTFSKAFGMAGCRVGYLVSNTNLVEKLLKFRSMYEINSFGILVAETMLDNYHFVLKYCSKVNEAKKVVSNLTKNLKIPTVCTQTNFLHFDFGKNKQNIIENFESNEILVKGGIKVQGYENYLRVSIGPINSMNKLVKIIQTHYE